jgi:hypothetical protein
VALTNEDMRYMNSMNFPGSLSESQETWDRRNFSKEAIRCTKAEQAHKYG